MRSRERWRSGPRSKTRTPPPGPLSSFHGQDPQKPAPCAGKLVPMLAPGGKGDDKAPQVHVHPILQRIAGSFQFAEFFKSLGGWVVGLGQKVVQDDGRLGGTRFNRSQYPQNVLPALINYFWPDLPSDSRRRCQRLSRMKLENASKAAMYRLTVAADKRRSYRI
jgi:hypothetical protein